MKNRTFREHGILLYLDKREYLAFIKLQADKGLGRSFAGKLAFCEGMFHLGYLNKEDYSDRVTKYSEGLTKEEVKSLAQLKEEAKIQQIEKMLTGAFQQWDRLSEKVKARHIKTAREHVNLTIAQRILEKGGIAVE